MARKRRLAARFDWVLLQLGYISLGEVQQMLARVGERMSEIDEALAREYMIDRAPGGIEQRIRQMCLRRKALFDKLTKDELQAERDRIAGGSS